MRTLARRTSPYRFHFLAAGALALAGTLALWIFLSGVNDWPHWVGCWLLAVNVVSFGYYGFDKSQARDGTGRVPETVLHSLTAIGGSVGSFVGMKLFRHKTIKGTFRIIFWCIILLQVTLALVIARMLGWF